MAAKVHSTFDREILSLAVVESFKKLNPLNMARNPVLFVCEVGAAITTAGLLVKPEGQRGWRWWTFWTQEKLRLDWELEDSNQVRYRVMSRQDWSQAEYYEYELTEGPVP